MSECSVYFAHRPRAFTPAKQIINNKIDLYHCSKKQARLEAQEERKIKIGETASVKSRRQQLINNEGRYITKAVIWDGNKAERLFIESYVRMFYSSNSNMEHYGNDHFFCLNSNTVKGAYNQFFTVVAQAFAVLETVTHKSYTYTCQSWD